jgi:hypothetical protein
MTTNEVIISYHATIKFDLRIPKMPSGKKKKRRWSAKKRWGNYEDMFSTGFLVVPLRYMVNYAAMKLTSNEAMFVLQLMTFKWDEDEPFPSYGRIANRMGVSEKMVRRYAQSLEKKGLLRRKFQLHAPNRFDLSALFSAIAQAPGIVD